MTERYVSCADVGGTEFCELGKVDNRQTKETISILRNREKVVYATANGNLRKGSQLKNYCSTPFSLVEIIVDNLKLKNGQ